MLGGPVPQRHKNRNRVGPHSPVIGPGTDVVVEQNANELRQAANDELGNFVVAHSLPRDTALLTILARTARAVQSIGERGRCYEL